MKSVRVGFVLGNADNSWLGGLNYFRSLITALDSLPTRRITPVVFVGCGAAPEFVKSLRNAEVVSTALLDRGSTTNLIQRICRKAFRWDGPLVRLLRRNRIEVLSHFRPLRPKSNIKTIGWIPDFQHTRLPEFFSSTELRARNSEFRRIAGQSDLLLLSSQDSQRDLVDFAPDAITKTRVLHFVPTVCALEQIPSLAELKSKYAFESPYFYLPNQFWVHKNHAIVLEALIKLKESGHPMMVLASGNTHDPRRPGHYGELMSRVKQGDVESQFKSLGIIPYTDLMGLMYHSQAVINPSLFEGWSTTVEEAKALGKTVILSRLPVHLEQNPKHCLYFDPASAGELARAMLEVADRPLGTPRTDIPPPEEKRREFAECYENMVLALISEAKEQNNVLDPAANRSKPTKRGG